MKKVLSLLLTILLAVSLLPMAAFAAEYGDGDEDGVQMTLTVEGTVQYTVNVSANTENYGTVSGGGTYNEGASVTVTATPNAGYIFTGWLENGKKVENAGASYTFTASADRNLTAVFEPKTDATCLLVVGGSDCLNISGVNVGGPWEFSYGTMITVTAVPKNAGIRFTGWRMANYDPTQPDEIPTLVSTEATYSFNIDRNIFLSAGSEVVQYATVLSGKNGEAPITVSSEYVNEKDCGYVFYTSDEAGNLQFHFPPADYFTAPEGKVFDCWEMKGVGYEAGSVQTVIGDGANPDFAGKDNVVTAKWKDDDSKTLKCVISIPALVEIPYGQEYTSVPWSVDTLELGDYDRVAVTFHDGVFRNQKNQEIRYSVKDIYDQDGSDSFVYKIKRPEELIVQVCIPKDSWDIAAPGNYTATMRFDVKGVYR